MGGPNAQGQTVQQQLDWYKLIYALVEDNINSGGPLKVTMHPGLALHAMMRLSHGLACAAPMNVQCVAQGGHLLYILVYQRRSGACSLTNSAVAVQDSNCPIMTKLKSCLKPLHAEMEPQTTGRNTS